MMLQFRRFNRSAQNHNVRWIELGLQVVQLETIRRHSGTMMFEAYSPPRTYPLWLGDACVPIVVLSPAYWWAVKYRLKRAEIGWNRWWRGSRVGVLSLDQLRQSGWNLRGRGSRVKNFDFSRQIFEKFQFFSGNFTKKINFSGQIFEKFHIFSGKFVKNLDFFLVNFLKISIVFRQFFFKLRFSRKKLLIYSYMYFWAH